MSVEKYVSIFLHQREAIAYAPIIVKPEGKWVRHRVGILTFSKKNYQNPHPRAHRHTVYTYMHTKKPFQIKWKILKKCKPYSNISKKCSLCLNEKFIIICKKELCSLNRRNELASSCPHRNRYVLRNFRVT